MGNKTALQCEICGASFERYPSAIREHNFCSRACAKKFTSKRMTNYNKTENKMNTPEGWSQEQKEAVRERELQNKPSKGKAYKKFHGRHEHRVNAEKKLGRKLKPGEVVHHIDGDKQNNEPENIMVFKNQIEHAKYHKQQEVMQNADHTK